MNYTTSVEKWDVFEFSAEGTTAATHSWNAVSLRYLKAIPSAKPSMVFTMGTEYTK